MRDNTKSYPDDFSLIKQGMIDYFLSFNTLNTSNVKAEDWQLISGLKAAGWHRRHVWELINEVFAIPHLQDEFIDIVGDYADTLVGFCPISNTDRFPGDPENLTELSDYVGSKKWQMD